MSEIEKLYENAGVEPYKYCYNCFDDNGERIKDSKDCPSRAYCCNTCDTPKYDFTAEKQLNLIKWLSKKADIGLSINKHITDSGASMVFDDLGYKSTLGGSYISFEECLANLINKLWQNLTDAEKEQIRDILIK